MGALSACSHRFEVVTDQSSYVSSSFVLKGGECGQALKNIGLCSGDKITLRMGHSECSYRFGSNKDDLVSHLLRVFFKEPSEEKFTMICEYLEKNGRVLNSLNNESSPVPFNFATFIPRYTPLHKRSGGVVAPRPRTLGRGYVPHCEYIS